MCALLRSLSMVNASRGKKILQRCERSDRRQLEELHCEEGSSADDDLRVLFERLHGRGVDEVEEEEMVEARQEIESMLNDFGIEIDSFPSLKPGVAMKPLAAKARK